MKRPDCKATFFIGKNNYNGPKKPPPGQSGSIREAHRGRRSRFRYRSPYARPTRKYDGTGPAAFRPINSAKPNERRARGNIDSGHAHGIPRSGISVVSGEKRRDET